jgi:predicted CoA-binding protein
MNEYVNAMLAAKTFAVVGASSNPEKYGRKAYEDLKAFGREVYPVNPRAVTIGGDRCYPSVSALPVVPEVVVAVVPPAITERLVEELADAGVKNLWMQPGAESPAAISRGAELGIRTVHSGPCIMVGLRTFGRK